MIDLTKLTPAPWNAEGCRVESARTASGIEMCIYDEGGHNETEAEFIALAREAFDVMMRRGWYAMPTFPPHEKGWIVLNILGKPDCQIHSDPFTALVEADKWYKANVEAKEK